MQSTQMSSKGYYGHTSNQNSISSAKVSAAPSSGNLTNAEKLAMKYVGSPAACQYENKRVLKDTSITPPRGDV
jgi:hypothetical protein